MSFRQVGAIEKWNKFGLVSFRQVGVIEKLKKLGLVSLKNGMNWGWCLLGRLVPSKKLNKIKVGVF